LLQDLPGFHSITRFHDLMSPLQEIRHNPEAGRRRIFSDKDSHTPLSLPRVVRTLPPLRRCFRFVSAEEGRFVVEDAPDKILISGFLRHGAAVASL
jgi:hypothetical protein